MPVSKSFLFYLDNKETLEDLSDEQLGMLLRYLIDYAETGNTQKIKDPYVQIAYKFMTAQMRRDMEKYEQKCRKNAENARKGGAPKGNQNAVKGKTTENNRTVDKTTETSERLKKQPKQPYTDTNTDTDTDKDKDTDMISSSTSKKSPKPPRHRYGEYQHVRLTEAQYQKLAEAFGEAVIREYIQKIDEWQEARGLKSYKNYALVIRQWMRRDGITERSGQHDKYAGTAAAEGFI